MITYLVRRRVWRLLPLWAIATALNTSVLLGAVAWHASTRHTTIPTLTVMLVTWVGVATYLAFADVRTRCTPFEMSLPVAPREIWLQSLVAVVGGGLVIVGLAAGVIAIHRALLTHIEFEPVGWLPPLTLCGGLILASLLLQAPKPSLARVPLTARNLLWTVLVLAGTPLLLALAVIAGRPGFAALALVVVAIAVGLYRSVPPAYALAPFEPGAAPRDDRGGSAGAISDTRTPLLLPLTIARSVSCGAKELLGAPLVVAFGMSLGGALLALGGTGLNELRFLYIPMTTYMLFSLVGPRLASLHHLDALPLSRRPLVAALLLPHLLLLCAGYGLGVAVASGARSRLEYVNFEKRESGFEVTVPLRVYRFARGGEVPLADSPWGETHAPEPLALFGGSGAVVYSPYSAPPGSSLRFVALQISRAVEAVYGASIPAETIEERYLGGLADGSVVPKRDGLTLRDDYPTLKARSGPVFPVLLMLTAVPWLLLTALLLRAYRAGAREWMRQAVMWGSLALMLFLFVGVSLLATVDLIRPWAVRALVEIPVMRLGQTAGGTLLVWLTAVLSLSAAYLLAGSQFRRMEIPSRPSRFTLLRVGPD